MRPWESRSPDDLGWNALGLPRRRDGDARSVGAPACAQPTGGRGARTGRASPSPSCWKTPARSAWPSTAPPVWRWTPRALPEWRRAQRAGGRLFARENRCLSAVARRQAGGAKKRMRAPGVVRWNGCVSVTLVCVPCRRPCSGHHCVRTRPHYYSACRQTRQPNVTDTRARRPPAPPTMSQRHDGPPCCCVSASRTG